MQINTSWTDFEFAYAKIYPWTECCATSWLDGAQVKRAAALDQLPDEMTHLSVNTDHGETARQASSFRG